MLAVVVGNGDGFHPGGQVGQSHIADSAFGLAYRLDHGSGGGHGQAAAHVVLVLQGAFFEKFVSSRRGFAGIDNDFHIGSSQLLPIGYLAAEYGFQLLACQLADRVGRVYNDGQGIIRYDYLLHFLFGGFQFHLFAEFDGTGSHSDICRVVHQGGNPHSGSPAGDGYPPVGIIFHENLGCFL